MAAGNLELLAFLLQCLEKLGIVDGYRRLSRKRLEQIYRILREFSGCFAPDDQGADDTILA
jgi:hypothetical protein